MARYIKKEDIQYEIMPLYAMPDLFVRAKDIEAMPDEDVAPVVHAHWTQTEKGVSAFRCSNCNGLTIFEDEKYCSNCGAKMDERS